MSMILFAYVVRVGDGLPLSASTDSEHSRNLQDCKRHLKILSKMLGVYPGRGTVKSNQLQIHFNCLQGVAYMTICCSFYPTTLAFCFLEELGVEFVSSYDYNKVHMASRPYAFLEFDSVIQKIKWHYNYSNRPSLKISVGNIQQELKVNPPRQVNVEDIVVTNGTINGHLRYYSGSAPRHRLEPASAVGILSIVLNIMCGALNLIRGVHLIEHLSQDDEDQKGNIITFLTAFATCLIQCYLFLFYVSARTVKALTAFATVSLCNIYLFGHRNVWQVLFHIGVASLSAQQTLCRRLSERPSELGV